MAADVDAAADARFTLSASTVRGALAYAAASGVDVAGILEQAGLRDDDIRGAEARLSQAANNAVIAEIVRRSGDQDFGLHMAERLDLDTFDVVGHLAAKSPTLGAAFERVCAFSRILHDSGRVDLERRGDEALLYPGCRGLLHEFPRHMAELSTLGALVLARRVTGTALVPRAVWFKHPQPARTTTHVRLFGVPPLFDQPETALVFDAKALSLPIRGAEPGLATYLDAYARDVLARLPPSAADDLPGAVERAVTTSLARGVPEVDAIATALGMSARTLQRRLTEAQTSYQAIVDRARKQLALRYLEDDRLALAEIGFLVGFADPSNFHRAFRRWTGTTPSAYRANRAGGLS